MAVMQQRNYLYQQTTQGHLQVQYQGNQPFITQSNFSGVQKMIVGRQFTYRINQQWQ